MDDVLIRALVIDAEAALRLGGLELATAVRASKQLIEMCPFRESALALRMDVLEALGNTAEALLTYDELAPGCPTSSAPVLGRSSRRDTSGPF